jgi:tetratricopeptide (TPR) repeat protein
MAAAYEDDIARKISLLAEAAASYARNAESGTLSRIVTEMKSIVASTGSGDIQLLQALQTLAEIDSDDETAMTILEEIVEIDPGDRESRFSLGYKHSQLGNHELSLWHYSKIPLAERNGITWNNLGVAREQLSLPIGSVNAYRRAAGMGETLAMSNLALRYLSAGFLEDAQEECDAALSMKDFHKNIGTTLGKLKAAPDTEETKIEKILKETGPKSDFYRQFGRALSRLELSNIASVWQGPDCALEVTVEDGKFVATGGYERPANSLGAGLFGSNASSLERYRVTYHGSIRGRAIKARISRIREGDPPKQTGLLSGEQEPRALMLIADGETEIRVMEFTQGNKHRFFKLQAVNSTQ